MRDWLKPGAEIPDDPEMAVDLTAPGYDTARGKRFHGSRGSFPFFRLSLPDLRLPDEIPQGPFNGRLGPSQ